MHKPVLFIIQLIFKIEPNLSYNMGVLSDKSEM